MPRSLTRRDFLRTSAALGAAGGVSALLAACGGSSHSPKATAGTGTGAGTSPTTAALTGTIDVWQHQEPAFNKAYASVVSAFEAAHPGVKVNSLYIPFQDLYTKTLTAFAGGTPPDVVKLFGPDVASFASKGVLAGVDPKLMGFSSQNDLLDNFMANSMTQLDYQGTYYGLPVDWNAMLMIYSIDDFKEVGLDPNKPPATWEDVVTYGEKLTKRDSSGKVTRAGFQWVYDAGPTWDYLNLLMLVSQLGGQVIDSSGKGQLNSKEGIQALTYYQDMSVKHHISSVNLTSPQYDQGTFGADQVSMYVASNWAVPLIPLANKNLKEGVNFNVAPVPQWANGAKKAVPAYTYGWCVAKQTKNPDLTWAFLRFLETSANASSMIQASDVIEPVKDWQKLVPNDPGAQIMAQAAPNLVYGTASPNWEKMASTLSPLMQSLARGQTTPQKAAASFDGTNFGA